MLRFCFLISLLAVSAQAQTVVRSPVRASVSEFSSIKWTQLRAVRGSDALTASITFTNEAYVSDTEPKREEAFDFVLPGVQFDRPSGTYRVKTARGPQAVAVGRKFLCCTAIELLPGARIEVIRRGSSARVQLVADRARPKGS
jgi:hypothetical protein